MIIIDQFFNFLIHSIFFKGLSSFYGEVEMGAAEPWQLLFQEPATPIMEGIIFFHNDLMVFIIAICIFVSWMLFRCIILFNEDNNKVEIFDNSVASIEESSISTDFLSRSTGIQAYSRGISHNTFIEIVWTIIPALILMVIAVPSFALLYSMEEFIEPSFTVKCTGHQWYWCYEYSHVKKKEIARLIDGIKFESYMLPTEDLYKGNLRLLEVDHRLTLPIKTHVEVVVTAADVLHCWAVPAFGIKIDACPGRLNQTSLFIKREGVFYGQCSEICGVNHGFMPIVVHAVSVYDFALKYYVKGILNKS